MFLYFSFCYYCCCFFFFVVFVFVFTETNLALFQSEDYTPFQERRSSANLVVKRGELGGTTTTSHRSDSKSLPQTIGVQCSPIERCDAWVKNRDNDLGSISGKGKEQLTAKARGIRELHTSCGHSSQLSLRGSSLNSPQRDSCSARAAESATCATGIDYSKYTDMFKNVLEFYGTRRLRPKSHSAVEQLLSMKTWIISVYREGKQAGDTTEIRN